MHSTVIVIIVCRLQLFVRCYSDRDAGECAEHLLRRWADVWRGWHVWG